MQYRDKFCPLHKEPLIFGASHIFGRYCKKCCPPLLLPNGEQNPNHHTTGINTGTNKARYVPIPFSYEEARCVRERGIPIKFVEYHLDGKRNKCATCGIALTSVSPEEAYESWLFVGGDLYCSESCLSSQAITQAAE